MYVFGPCFVMLLRKTQLSMKVIMLINAKMPTIIGILTFISMINTTYDSLKARKYLFFSSDVILSC